MSTADPFLPIQPVDDRNVPDDDLVTDVEVSVEVDDVESRDAGSDDAPLSQESAQQEDPPFRTPHPGDRLTEGELAEDSSDS